MVGVGISVTCSVAKGSEDFGGSAERTYNIETGGARSSICGYWHETGGRGSGHRHRGGHICVGGCGCEGSHQRRNMGYG